MSDERYWHDAVISLDEFPDDPAFPKVALRLVELVGWVTSGHEPKGTVTFSDGAVLPARDFTVFVVEWAAMAEEGEVDSVGGAQFGAELFAFVHGIEQ